MHGDPEGRLGADDGPLRPLDELRPGELVRATVTSHQPWGLTAKLLGFEPVGASLDMIRRGSEPGVRRLALSVPAVGTTVEFVVGRVKPWHQAPWVWVDLTTDTPAGGTSSPGRSVSDVAAHALDGTPHDGNSGPGLGSYFQRVQWLHDRREDPLFLWAHVVDGWEVRRVDEFADGRLAWADDTHEDETTGLGKVPVSRPEKIATDPQFVVEIVERSDFDRVWLRARGGAPTASSRPS